MAYTLTLTHPETTALCWLSARYRYAEILFNAMDPYTGVVTLPEHKAWELAESVESGEDGGFLPCVGGTLVDKVSELLNRIV